MRDGSQMLDSLSPSDTVPRARIHRRRVLLENRLTHTSDSGGRTNACRTGRSTAVVDKAVVVLVGTVVAVVVAVEPDRAEVVVVHAMVRNLYTLSLAVEAFQGPFQQMQGRFL